MGATGGTTAVETTQRAKVISFHPRLTISLSQYASKVRPITSIVFKRCVYDVILLYLILVADFTSFNTPDAVATISVVSAQGPNKYAYAPAGAFKV